MKLQAGRALNHKGIFIEGLGVQYHQHKIIVNVNAHDVLAGDVPTYRGLATSHCLQKKCMCDGQPSALVHFLPDKRMQHRCVL